MSKLKDYFSESVTIPRWEHWLSEGIAWSFFIVLLLEAISD